MTKKDYVLIAKTIKSTLELYPESLKALKALAIFLRSELYAQNNRFDENRFMEACGIVESE